MRTWTNEEIFQAMSEWEDAHGQLPNHEDWKRAEDNHPTYMTLWTRFGTLDELYRQYKRWAKRKKKWTSEEIMAAFHRYEQEFGRPPVETETKKYRWLPSPSSVNHCFGTWNKAIEAAGWIPMPRGVRRDVYERYLPLPRKEKT